MITVLLVIVVVLLVLVAAVVVLQLPEIRRYLKIRAM